MIFLNFLYYIVYRVFKLVPRRQQIDHFLASSFLAGLIMTNILTGLCLLNFFIYLSTEFAIHKFHWIVILIFTGCYFFNKWYFLKTENYKIIINTYDEKFKNQQSFIITLGVFYIIGTFIGFWALAFYFDKT